MDKAEKEKQEEDRTVHKIKINTPDIGYAPFPVSIINRVTREIVTFDPSLGKPASIYYKLTKAGTIRLRIVRKDNPELLLATLQDWTEQAFGEHEVQWDGRDASGNIIDNKRVLIQFDARDQAFGCKHLDHDTDSCFDPELTITTEPETSSDVKGNLEITTSLTGGTDRPKQDSGCEVRYFVDHILLKKDKFENIGDKFHLTLDTTGLSDGEHIITVNIDDLNDHIGTASLRVSVKN